MATISFEKNFTITKEETIERLEKSIGNVKPLNIESNNIAEDLKRSENKLLNILRSKH